MSDVMVISGSEVEHRFMSAMNRGIERIYNSTESLRALFGYAAEECNIPGSHSLTLADPHATHAAGTHPVSAHTANHDDEKAHDSFAGWLDWRANSNKQESWAVRINDMMRKAGAAFSYFNLPSFFPKRPPTRSIHAPPFTHGARPEV